MIELKLNKKPSFSLLDYDYQRDINYRLFLSQTSALDILVLEEIIYSPLKVYIQKMAKNLSLTEKELLKSLEKWGSIDLLKIENDTIFIDKEVRRFFEVEIERFQDHFIPGMEFLQSLLKKVPIHILPLWYSLPRGSDHIFASIVEKHLKTPSVFYRYIAEVKSDYALLSGIIDDLFASTHLELLTREICEKYSLSPQKLEECILILELRFIGCMKYQKTEDFWEQKIVPFKEWADYILFLRKTALCPIPKNQIIIQKDKKNFVFIENLSLLLNLICHSPSTFSHLHQLCPHWSLEDFQCLYFKLKLLELIEIKDDILCISKIGRNWLALSFEGKALFLYRHPKNTIAYPSLPKHLITDKCIREVEKSLFRVVESDWVLYSSFIEGLTISLANCPAVYLGKAGKSWKYHLPSYPEEEKKFIHFVIFNWLWEIGIIETGQVQDQDCFRLTSFGKTLFG